MSDQSKQMGLSRWIRTELEDGIVLTDDVLNYLDVTFGTCDLSSVLADADDSEIDSMLELVFYPDLRLQMKYEAQWGRVMFTERDKDAVIVALGADPITAGVTVPGAGQKITIPVPGFVLQAFVQRMNICWQPPAMLTEAIGAHCEDNSGLTTRVQLRNSRLAWHNAQISLMCRFLSKMPTSSETFESDLGFLLSIFSELAPEKDAYTFLIDKKFFYFQSLCNAEDFERKRLSSNMEIMMMSGARSAHGSIDQWRKSMRRIDRICQTLFGRTQFFQQPDSHCIDTQDGLNLQAVTRLLS